MIIHSIMTFKSIFILQNIFYNSIFNFIKFFLLLFHKIINLLLIFMIDLFNLTGSFLTELNILEIKIFVTSILFLIILIKVILKTSKFYTLITVINYWFFFIVLSELFQLLQASIYTSLINLSITPKLLFDQEDLYRLTEIPFYNILDSIQLLWENYFIIYMFRHDFTQWRNSTCVDFLNHSKLEYITNTALLNIFFLTLFIFLYYISLLIFSQKDKNKGILLLISIFFLNLNLIFISESSSLLIFFIILEIFSFYFFFLVFSEKQTVKSLIINFSMFTLSILSSIFFLLSLYLYYSETGHIILNTIFIELSSYKWFLASTLIFLLLKIGFLPVMLIFLVFYKNINIQAFFTSLFYIKSFIFWFLLSNYIFFKQLWLNLFEFNKAFHILIFSILLVSIFISFYLYKTDLFCNKALVFLSSYISSILILFLWISSNTYLSVYYTIIYYFIFSTILLSLAFLAISKTQFIIIMLSYLGFPGILFFVKLNFFSYLFFLNSNLVIIISLIIISMFTFFIQEVLFKLSYIKFNKSELSSNNIIAIYKLLNIYVIIFLILIFL